MSYRKQFGLLRNKAVYKEIQSLDPAKDHCRIVHLMTGYEFPWDVVRALEIALLRTFCSPSISGLLHRTGEFRKHGQKRYDDTAILVSEFMQNGYDSERGARAITHMNKIHALYKINNDDYIFVLSTFIFLPIQWIDNFGWRKMSAKEKQALFLFFTEVGQRMHISHLPSSLQEMQQFVKVYEQRHFTYSDSNKALATATINIVKGWMPFFAKPFVLPVVRCLLDEKMLYVLGYTPPAAVLKKTVRLAMKARAFFLGIITFKKYPSFVSTEPSRTYPAGYQIEQLGPEALIRKI